MSVYVNTKLHSYLEKDKENLPSDIVGFSYYNPNTGSKITEHIEGVLAGNDTGVSGYTAQQILNYALQNATGTEVYTVEQIPDVLGAGLPADVVWFIPGKE